MDPRRAWTARWRTHVMLTISVPALRPSMYILLALTGSLGALGCRG